MPRSNSLFNALISLVVIAILSVVASIIKTKNKDKVSVSNSLEGDVQVTLVEQPENYNWAVDNSTGRIEQIAKMSPSQNALNHYEILTGCTFMPLNSLSGSRYRIKYAGKEIGFRLYYVNAPELPSGTEGYRKADLNDRTFSDSQDEMRYFSAKEFAQKILTNTPFHIFTSWESTGDDNEYFAFIYLLEKNKERRYWLSEVLAASGYFSFNHCDAKLPDGKTSSESYEKRISQLITKGKSEVR